MPSPTPPETWALLGASRGLGRAFFEVAQTEHPHVRWELVARRFQGLEASSRVTLTPADLSRPQEREALWQRLFEAVRPKRLFYFAGGGPYGTFEKKDLKDHRWALETTFFAPLEMIHAALRAARPPLQVVVIGSAVAEDRADPWAASYSSAKHALLGLMKSLWAEEKGVDLRLFSPGYMDTDLLPPGATARQGPLSPPQEVARQLLDWCLDLEGPAHYK